MEQQQAINSLCFFTRNNLRKMKSDRSSMEYFDSMHSSYLLDVSNKTGSIFMLNQHDLCVIGSKKLDEVLNRNTSRKVYDEYDFGDDDPRHLTMVRLSPCETMMAIVHLTNIVVIYLPDFLPQKEPKVETNFEIKESDYAYMEWAPFNEIYCENQYFLTVDSSGKLRTHFVFTEEMFSNLDERFYCATFSVDGGIIYAINYHQELCIIDPLNVQVVSKRKINELGDSNETIPTQMMQITPKILVVGSLCKPLQEKIENSEPYLLILAGDLLDDKAKLNVIRIKMNLSRLINPEKLPDFRFHYVKERQLLLFSHTESSHVQALKFDENGDHVELDPLDLEGGSTVRGFVFYKATLTSEEKHQMIQVEHQNQRFALPSGPRIFVLDSSGCMHPFNYYVTRYFLSILMDPIKLEVLRGIKLAPAIIANRSMITPESLNQKVSITEQIQNSGLIFEYQGSCKSMKDWSDENADTSFMLDCIPEIGQILAVNGKRCGITNYNILDWRLKFHNGEVAFSEYNAQEDKGDIRMVRVSDCKYLVAMMYESRICIQKTEVFVDPFGSAESRKKLEAEFTLSEEGRRYTSLEWPSLSLSSLDSPYFLTLDDKGTLRIHYVKEGKEEVIEKEQVFRCANFSLDGNFIYAINEKQEICKIYLGDLKIVIKRKIQEEIISSHIQQLTPNVFAIGSMIIQTGPENSETETNFKPYLHLVCGDFSYLKEELEIKKFEMPLSETKKSFIFRFVYEKEKNLLFFGHTGSNEVLTLHFLDDHGSALEINRFNLQEGTTLRGMFFVKEMRLTQKTQLGSRSKGIEVKRPPYLLILDSKGNLHHFRYSEIQSSEPKCARLLLMSEFLKRKTVLKQRFNKKENPRGKSQTRKIINIQEKKRPKSPLRINHPHSETKISLEEKQRKMEILKGNHIPGHFSPAKEHPKTESKTLQTIIVTPEDRVRKALLFMNKDESDVIFKVEDQEFPAQKSILSEKYKFFKNMWTSGMTESRSDLIEISDTKASTFKAFLMYVYLDMILLNEELAFGLFEFAERYLINDMKVHCEKYLGDSLTLDNCIKIFETANFYDAVFLKEKALLFFRKNLKQITDRKDFEDLPKWSYISLKKLQWSNDQYENESETHLSDEETIDRILHEYEESIKFK